MPQAPNSIYKNVRNLSNLYNYQFDNSFSIGGSNDYRQVRLGVKQVDLANQRNHNFLPSIMSKNTPDQFKQRPKIMKVIKDGRVEPVIGSQTVERPHINRIETEESFCEGHDNMWLDLSLNMIKPVLKRSLYHL